MAPQQRRNHKGGALGLVTPRSTPRSERRAGARAARRSSMPLVWIVVLCAGATLALMLVLLARHATAPSDRPGATGRSGSRERASAGSAARAAAEARKIQVKLAGEYVPLEQWVTEPSTSQLQEEAAATAETGWTNLLARGKEQLGLLADVFMADVSSRGTGGGHVEKRSIEAQRRRLMQVRQIVEAMHECSRADVSAPAETVAASQRTASACLHVGLACEARLAQDNDVHDWGGFLGETQLQLVVSGARLCLQRAADCAWEAGVVSQWRAAVVALVRVLLHPQVDRLSDATATLRRALLTYTGTGRPTRDSHHGREHERGHGQDQGQGQDNHYGLGHGQQQAHEQDHAAAHFHMLLSDIHSQESINANPSVSTALTSSGRHGLPANSVFSALPASTLQHYATVAAASRSQHWAEASTKGARFWMRVGFAAAEVHDSAEEEVAVGNAPVDGGAMGSQEIGESDRGSVDHEVEIEMEGVEVEGEGEGGYDPEENDNDALHERARLYLERRRAAFAGVRLHLKTESTHAAAITRIDLDRIVSYGRAHAGAALWHVKAAIRKSGGELFGFRADLDEAVSGSAAERKRIEHCRAMLQALGHAAWGLPRLRPADIGQICNCRSSSNETVAAIHRAKWERYQRTVLRAVLNTRQLTILRRYLRDASNAWRLGHGVYSRVLRWDSRYGAWGENDYQAGESEGTMPKTANGSALVGGQQPSLCKALHPSLTALVRQIVGGTGTNGSEISPTYCYALSYRSDLSSRLEGHFDSPDTPYTLTVQLRRGMDDDSVHSNSRGTRSALGAWLQQWLNWGGSSRHEFKPWPLYLRHSSGMLRQGAKGAASNEATGDSLDNDSGDISVTDKPIAEVQLSDGDAALFDGSQWFHYRTRLDTTKGHGEHATFFVFHFA